MSASTMQPNLDQLAGLNGVRAGAQKDRLHLAGVLDSCPSPRERRRVRVLA